MNPTKTFTDTLGRPWTVEITVRDVKRVRSLAGLDLLSLIEGKMEGLAELANDTVQLVDVLYVLCKDEADRLGIGDEEFGVAFSGDVLESATSAFLEAFADFSRSPAQRAAIRKIANLWATIRERTETIAMDRLGAIDAEANAEIDRTLARLTGSSGVSPASSASTPDPSPSANST